MKRILFLIVVLSLVCAAVFANGTTEENLVLKWGSSHSTTSITTQMMMKAIEIINEKCEGRVEIQGYPNSVIGGSRDLVEGIQSGIVDIVTEGPGQFSSWIPMASAIETPFLWQDSYHLKAALNGSLGEMLENELSKLNVHVLGNIYYGTRQLSTSNKAIYNVSDCQGLKIRVPESDIYLDMIRSWGASPTPMTFSELYLALQQNVVDGQENPLPTFDSAKFDEVQKYIIMTGHVVNPLMIFINANTWKKISPADQKIIQDAIDECIVWHDNAIRESETKLVGDLEARGVTFINPDVESFRTAVMTMLKDKKYEDRWGLPGFLDKMSNLEY